MPEVTVDFIVFFSFFFLFFYVRSKIGFAPCKSTFVNISILYLKTLVGGFILGPKCT